jgi:GMP synthase (glutamine-hydrolysing)
MAHQLVLVLDFGSQYTQLIARRIREQSVYCEIHPYTLANDLAKVRALRPIGIVLSGGPSSVYEEGAPTIPAGLYELGVPVLGICYGAQLTAKLLGGVVRSADKREYGRATVRVKMGEGVFRGLAPGEELAVWASHGDHVDALPPGFAHTAESANCAMSGFSHPARKIHCVQFHPEVVHTPRGAELLGNFLFGVCGAAGDWSMASFVDEAVARIREQVGSEGRVVCGLSGGVDSSVAAALIHRAIGDRLTCIFVDNGLLRKGEREQVALVFRDHFRVDLRVIDAESSTPRRASSASSPTSQIRRRSARSSVTSSSPCSRKKRSRSRTRASSLRGLCTPTSSRASASKVPATPSRATTTSAGCRSACTSSWWSRCASCSRTRSASSGWSWACRATWCGASPSRAQASPCVAWAT